MSDVVIRARGLGKAYRIYQRPLDRLRHTLFGVHQRHYREFWALRDINFDVKRGQAMAIVGRNGSGKSTLLQLVAGTMRPTVGTIETAGGRLAALLELGSGFNPEFTGRENVYLNAAILGHPREFVDEHFSAMLDFAGLHAVIDQPVKTYSSGMYVRLAFSAQVFSQPEVLIVDEALSVGDVFFQQKCFERLRKLRDAGVTLLFVTHDTAAVQTFCDEALLLDEGTMIFQGRPAECVTRYHALATPVGAEPASPATAARAAPAADAPVRNLLASARSRHGARDLEILSIYGYDAHGGESLAARVQEPAHFLVELRANRAIAQPSVGLQVYNRMGTLVFAAGSRQLEVFLAPLTKGELLQLRLSLTCNLYPEKYTVSIVAGEPSPDDRNGGVFHDVVEGLGPLIVHADPARGMPFFGIAQLPLAIAPLSASGQQPAQRPLPLPAA